MLVCGSQQQSAARLDKERGGAEMCLEIVLLGVQWTLHGCWGTIKPGLCGETGCCSV
jgi:hypothetical protein